MVAGLVAHHCGIARSNGVDVAVMRTGQLWPLSEARYDRPFRGRRGVRAMTTSVQLHATNRGKRRDADGRDMPDHRSDLRAAGTRESFNQQRQHEHTDRLTSHGWYVSSVPSEFATADVRMKHQLRAVVGGVLNGVRLSPTLLEDHRTKGERTQRSDPPVRTVWENRVLDRRIQLYLVRKPAPVPHKWRYGPWHPVVAPAGRAHADGRA